MKIDWDEKCDFGGAFENAYIQYRSRSVRGGKIYNHYLKYNDLIYWCNAVYSAGYEIIAIKNFDAKKLFKWAGINDYPECMSRNLQNTRKV